MTNHIALALGLFIIGFFALDHFVLHMGAGLLIARKFMELIGWVAFWR